MKSKTSKDVPVGKGTANIKGSRLNAGGDRAFKGKRGKKK